MKSRKLLFALLLLAMSMTSVAEDFDGILVNTKQNKWASSKFFAKGIEAINDDDLYEALEMFEKEMKQHPSNGYAICNLAQCQYIAARHEMFTVIYSEDSDDQEIAEAQEQGYKDMRAALPLLDKGIALLPTGDGEAQCQVYRIKASMLRSLDNVDSTQVAECYDKAIAAHPCNDAYEEHMDFFFNDPEIVTADALALRKLYPDDPSNVKLLAYMAYRNEDYAQSLELCEEYQAMLHSQGEEGLDTQVAAIRLMSLKYLGRNEEAMDLALSYIEDFEMGEAIQVYLLIAKNNPDIAEIKLKQRIFADNGDNMLWNTMLGHIMEFKKDYASALNYFKQEENNDHEAYILNEIAKCYYMLGDTQNALTYIDAATIMPDGGEYLLNRDEMLINLGMASKVISEKMTGVEIVKKIDDTEYLHRLNLAELLLQEQDFSQAATILEPLLDLDDGARALSLYATALNGMGRNDDAKKYLQQIVDINPIAQGDIFYLIPALNELGQCDEAKKQAEALAAQWMQYQIEPKDDSTPESCYNIATTFAQIGDSDTALEYLEKHFEHDDMPYNFGFIERDWRINSLRELPQFKRLVEKYKTQWKNNSKTFNKQ